MAVTPRFGAPIIAGNETVDFAALNAIFAVFDTYAAGLSMANTYTAQQTVRVGATASTPAVAFGTTGNATDRHVVLNDGTHQWGDGSAARDTTLYRSAADTLKTDDALEALGLRAGTGAVGAPAYSFVGDGNTGFYSASADVMGVSVGGVARGAWHSVGLRLGSSVNMTWSSTADPTAGADVTLARTATATLGLTGAMSISSLLTANGNVAIAGSTTPRITLNDGTRTAELDIVSGILGLSHATFDAVFVSATGIVTFPTTGDTGTGAIVHTTSPTLVTPTIASFVNAQHTHATAAAGGAITLESLYTGATQVSAVAVNPVAASILWVFCTAAITVTLPPASTTNRPITVAAVTGQSTVASQGGSIFGGSAHPTTGAIQNGTVAAGEAFTYKSDGTNWRAT